MPNGFGLMLQNHRDKTGNSSNKCQSQGRHEPKTLAFSLIAISSTKHALNPAYSTMVGHGYPRFGQWFTGSWAGDLPTQNQRHRNIKRVRCPLWIHMHTHTEFLLFLLTLTETIHPSNLGSQRRRHWRCSNCGLFLAAKPSPSPNCWHDCRSLDLSQISTTAYLETRDIKWW